jgi:hypothetical protein
VQSFLDIIEKDLFQTHMKGYTPFVSSLFLLCMFSLAVACGSYEKLEWVFDIRGSGNRVTYLRLDGSVETEKRFDIVKAFNADPTIDVLLLTTHGECRMPTRYWEYNS